MRPTPLGCLIVLSLLAAPWASAQPGGVERILRAPDGAAHEEFGSSVAVLGATVAVGAPRAAGPVPATGACYLFDMDTGELLHKLQPTDPEPLAQFGSAVALTPSHVLVGARDASVAGLDYVGRVYVFDRATGEQMGTIEPDVPVQLLRFGHRLASTEKRVVITALGTLRTGHTPVIPGEAWLHNAADLSLIGELFRPAGGSDDFGADVTIDDSHIAIGAGFVSGGGDIHLYDTNGTFIRRYHGPDDVPPGTSWGVNAALSKGEMFVPLRNRTIRLRMGEGEIWAYGTDQLPQNGTIQRPAGQGISFFGESIAATEHALIVGSYAEDAVCTDCGAAFIYTLPDRTFFARIDGVPSSTGGPRLGTAIAAEGDYAAVAAVADDQNGPFSGAVYIIRLPGGR